MPSSEGFTYGKGFEDLVIDGHIYVNGEKLKVVKIYGKDLLERDHIK